MTPAGLVAWAKVSLMDASHFDVNTAYAAINTLRLDDLRPHIYRTRDGGKTWQHITSGIPDGGIINVVREDPQRRGLLFAGSEQAVYVSFDDGDRTAHNVRYSENPAPHRWGCAEDGEAQTWGETDRIAR